MKTIQMILISILFVSYTSVSVEAKLPQTEMKNLSYSKLTIEPGIGLNPMPISDLVFSNLLQWNYRKKLSFISYSSYNYNNAFIRKFNFIETNYNYSLSEKIGVGTTFYKKYFTHTVSFMAGVKYYSFKETMNNPEFEKVSISINSTTPDFGLLYNLKVGKKKLFFSYRMYIPLYPYPFKTTDIFSIDGNFANVSMEFGLGIRLK